MKGIFSEGQLDESELTFKDLHKLSENFARILTGLFHQRIAYPDINRKQGHDKGREETEAGKVPAAPAKPQTPAASSPLPPLCPHGGSASSSHSTTGKGNEGMTVLSEKSTEGPAPQGQGNIPENSSHGTGQQDEKITLLTPEMRQKAKRS